MKRRSFFKSAIVLSGVALLKPFFGSGTKANSVIPSGTSRNKRVGDTSIQKGEGKLGINKQERFILEPDHISAAQRNRRIVVNLDTGWGIPGVEDIEVEKFVEAFFEYLSGMKASQVDSIWWCWGDMNYAPYPSKILPANLDYQKWLKQGKDPLPIVIELSKKKGIEAFYTFRINESGSGGIGAVEPWVNWGLWSAIKKNPQWGQPSPFWPAPFQHFNFAVAEVREYKLAIIREVVENYDFDGIEIDWRCGYGSLPFYHKWENRDHLTTFMRSVREMLLKVEEKRGRPYLLAARIPENIEGCHYDGIHVERWIAENLVDILALGCKSFEIDFAAFRRLTEGKCIKLYPSMDDHHRASGYEQPTIELYRGAASNFLQQSADGIYAFNWYPVPIILDSRANPEQEKLRRNALCEMGSLGTLLCKDKKFVMQRRGGGGWPETAEHMYKNSSAFAQLPMELYPPGQTEGAHGFVRPKKENYLFLQVGDDVNALAGEVAMIDLRILLSDPNAAGLPWEERMYECPIRIASMSSRDLNEPPALTLVDQLRVRINGVILDQPAIHDGWLIYRLTPVHLAHGRNVIAILLTGTESQEKGRITVEKLEIEVQYKT
jgi:hypothetical protein